MPRALILGGARTPFVKAGTAFAELDVLDLARAATAEALAWYAVGLAAFAGSRIAAQVFYALGEAAPP